MISREEFKKKLLELLKKQKIEKLKCKGEQKGSPFSMGGSR